MDHNTEYLQALIDGIPDPVVVIGRDYSVRFINCAAKSLISADLQSRNGLRCYQIHHDRREPCDSENTPCPLRDVFETGKPAKVYHRHTTQDAVQEIIEISASPIVGDKGEVIEVEEMLHRVSDKDIAERLMASEERLQGLVESAMDAIITMSADGIIIYANNSTARIFGYADGELIGKPVATLMPERFYDEHIAMMQSSVDSRAALKAGRTIELIALRKDGLEIPVELSLSSWKTGAVMYYNAIIRDITARRRAEVQLQVSREAIMKEHEELSRIFKLVEIAKREWEKTMDCVDDMVILTDKQGRVKRCNRSFKEFIGKAYDELLGRDCMDLLVGHGIVMNELHTREIEVFYRPSERWFRINTYPARSIDGDLVSGTVITIHDSTDIKLVTQRLERSNREIEDNRQGLQCALDELSLLIQRVAKEKAFDIRFSNPNLEKCYETRDCIKTDCPCYDKEASRCWQIVGTHCGGKIQGEFAQKYANCVECDVFKASAPTPILQIGEHFNNMMNILELKNRELENAYSELKLTQAKILQQEKMASIGQLAAGVAHEINNPMGFISSNLGTLDKYLARIIEYTGVLTAIAENLHDIVVDDRLNAERKRLKIDVIICDAKKLIAESLEGAERVKTIVQNLKSFSRVDQSHAMDADINECIETTLNIVWNELKYKASVRKEYGVLPHTWCYPQQLNQVFMNLLVNAAQALEKQGEVAIRTWTDNGSIFISVADTGIGISEKNLSKIFEPFFTTKEVGKGTGLGLSITYDIVKKHNGDIAVQSEVGKGTVFTVRIPVKVKEEDN